LKKVAGRIHQGVGGACGKTIFRKTHTLSC